MRHLNCRVCRVVKKVADHTESVLCLRCSSERNVCGDDAGADSACCLPLYHDGDHMSVAGEEWPRVPWVGIPVEAPEWLR